MTIVFESVHNDDMRPAVDKAGYPVRSPYEGVCVYTIDAAAVEARALKLLEERDRKASCRERVSSPV